MGRREITTTLETNAVLELLEYFRDKTKGQTIIGVSHARTATQVYPIADFIELTPRLQIRRFDF